MDFYAFSYYYDLAANVGLIGEGPWSGCGAPGGCPRQGDCGVTLRAVNLGEREARSPLFVNESDFEPLSDVASWCRRLPRGQLWGCSTLEQSVDMAMWPPVPGRVQRGHPPPRSPQEPMGSVWCLRALSCLLSGCGGQAASQGWSRREVRFQPSAGPQVTLSGTMQGPRAPPAAGPMAAWPAGPEGPRGLPTAGDARLQASDRAASCAQGPPLPGLAWQLPRAPPSAAGSVGPLPSIPHQCGAPHPGTGDQPLPRGASGPAGILRKPALAPGCGQCASESSLGLFSERGLEQTPRSRESQGASFSSTLGSSHRPHECAGRPGTLCQL